jgi:AraC-like DNA-binding protein
MVWDFINILNIISAFLLIFFSFFLIRNKRGKKLSNWILAVFLFTNALALVNYVIYQKKEFSSPWILDYLIFGNSLVFLWGPLLYFYVRSIIHRDFSFQMKHSIHLFPFFVYFLYLMIKMIISSKNIVNDLAVAKLAFHPLEIFILSGFLHALFLFYIFASFRSLRIYRQQIKHFFSTTKNLKFSWLSIILISFSLMWTIGFLNSSLTAKTGSPVPVLSLINLALIFFIANMTVYKGLNQPEIFSGIEERPKYEKSTLTKSDADFFLTKLKNLMEEKKPHLDTFLNINQLARRLNIQPRHLSQILNESLHQNFYDFVNSYRIEEAKKMLLDSSNEKTTVLEVLLDVGFNSKSAFNRTFKKNTGLTPSQFKKMNLR